MKKILTILASLTMTVGAAASVIACGLVATQEEKIDQHKDLTGLSLDVDFDAGQNATFDGIAFQVANVIHETQPNAVLGEDYWIDLSNFTLAGQLLGPNRITVRAMTWSNYLVGQFEVVVWKDLAPITNQFATQGTYDLGYEQETILIDQIKMLAPNAVPTVDYEIAHQPDGSWSIVSLDNSIIKVNFAFNNQTADISGLSLPAVMVKDELATVYQDIASQIQTLHPYAVENVDYEIIGTTETGGTTIQVAAKAGSKRLTGAFEIEVLKANINNLKVADLNVLITEADLGFMIQNEINKLAEDLDAKVNVDFTITNETNQVMVTALPTSTLIDGSAVLEVAKISLDSLGAQTDLTIPFNASADLIADTVLPLINSQLMVRNEQRQTATLEDFTVVNSGVPNKWTIQARETSKLISDSFTFMAGQFDLSAIADRTALVGNDYETLISETIQQINEAMGTAKVEQWVDYQIIDDSNFATEAGTITIEATPDSQLIAGQVEIVVNRRDISDVVLSETPLPIDELEHLNELIATKINQVFENTDLKIDLVDFEVLNEAGQVVDLQKNWQGGTFIVNAEATSRVITGSFKFVVDQFDLSTLSMDDLVVGVNLDFTFEKINERLQFELYHLALDPDVDYEIIDNSNGLTEVGTLTVQAREGSTLLKNSFDIQVIARSINNGSLRSFDRTELDQVERSVLSSIQNFFGHDNRVTVTQADFDIFDPTGAELDVINSPAGTYTVKASPSSKIISGEFNFVIGSTSIASLADQFTDIDITSSADMIEDQIAIAIYKLAGKELTVGTDYVVLDEAGQPKDLGTQGTVVVKAQDTGYISGQFSFEIKPFDLSSLSVDDFDGLNVTMSEAEVFSEVLNTIRQKTGRYEITQDTDYTLGTASDWVLSRGTTELQATADSQYLTGSLALNLTVNKYDLTNLAEALTGRYQIGGKLSAVMSDITNELNMIFKDSWLASPVLGTDYEFRGINGRFSDDVLHFAGNQSLAPTALRGSLTLVGTGNINVDGIESPTGNDLFNMSTSGYSLRANVSTFTINAGLTPAFGGGANVVIDSTPNNPIQANEILGLSKNFLVTTRGVFIGPKLIAGTANLNLVASDVVLVSEFLVITTKGSWRADNLANNDAAMWTATIINDVDFTGIRTNNILAFMNERTLITTRGVWELFDEARVIVFRKVTEIPATNLRNFIMANDRFMIFGESIWYRFGTGSNSSFRAANIQGRVLSSDDQIELGTNYVLINNQDLIASSTGTISRLGADVDILMSNKSYLVTTTAIFYNGMQIDAATGPWTSDDILGMNDKYIITTRGVYYTGLKTVLLPDLKAEELLDFNDQFVVTTKGILFRNIATAALNGTVGLTKDDIYAMSSRFLAVRTGTYYVANNQVSVMNIRINTTSTTTRAVTITKEQVTAVNDYFFVTSVAIWAMNGEEINQVSRGLIGEVNNPLRYTIADADELLLLQGRVLLTKNQGFYWLKDAYWGSDNRPNAPWVAEDLMMVTADGQIYTQKGIWMHWRQGMLPF